MHEEVNLEAQAMFEYKTEFYNKGFTRSRGKGVADIIDNIKVDKASADSYAKTVYNITNNTTRYFIKAENRKILNPYDGSTRRRIIGRNISWLKVSFAAFDNYIKFLRTQHTSFLHFAEREI